MQLFYPILTTGLAVVGTQIAVSDRDLIMFLMIVTLLYLSIFFNLQFLHILQFSMSWKYSHLPLYTGLKTEIRHMSHLQWFFGLNKTRRATSPNSFIFMHFSAKHLKNNSTFGSWHTPLGKILDPPLNMEHFRDIHFNV